MDYRWKVTYIGRRNPRRRVPMVAQIHRRNVDIVRPCRPASLCTAIFNIRVDPLETRFELSRIPNLDSCLSRAPGRVGDRSAQSSKSSSSSRGAPAPAGCGAVGRCRNCGMWRVVGPSGTLSDMVNKPRAQDVAWRLAESMVSTRTLAA